MLNGIFLLLSMLSSLLELGPVVLLIATMHHPSEILGAGLAYQIGNLAASTLRMSRTLVISFLLGAAVCAALARETTGLFYVSVLLTSLGTQKLRRFSVAINPGPSASTFIKRLVRIIGFALVGLISYGGYLLLVVGLLVIATTVALWRKESWADTPPIHKPRSNPLAGIMVVHQSHYFSYAYLIPWLFVHHLKIPVLFVGLAFILGWLSYVSTERLVRHTDLL